MKKQAQTDGQDRNETMNRVKELQDFIKKQKTKITDFDESQVKTLIQRITVFPGYFVVAFKSGVSVDITE
ncbi:integrase [Stomatobaculum longum]|jgi:site-specific recombinase, phage integrase family|uniref:integrase n=1 Tax=Stomatobaculum longum TaxID=796942 RepID=UPI0028DBC61C|nr:integrase [Stomatobaculum longum]